MTFILLSEQEKTYESATVNTQDKEMDGNFT
jgi:hypothetical protein